MHFDSYKPPNKGYRLTCRGIWGGYLVEPEGQNNNCFHSRESQLLEGTFAGPCAIPDTQNQPRNSRTPGEVFGLFGELNSNWLQKNLINLYNLA